MTDCKHVVRFMANETIHPLTQEQQEAGWMQMQDGARRWGPCVPCLQERIAALEEQGPADGTGSQAARIGGTAVVRIEADERLVRVLEAIAPVIAPLLAKWLGVKRLCPHHVEEGTYCSGCYGPAKAA